MVMIKPIGAPSQTDELVVWLKTRDVYTSIPRRPYPRRKVRSDGARAQVKQPEPKPPYRPQGTDEPL